jgi:predicted DNA-binding ribbon-helix-helix protein
MAMQLRKQSFLKIDGSASSVSLEPDFWDALKEIAGERGITPTALLREVDRHRAQANLTSALRLFVLEHFIAKGQNEVRDQAAA